MSARRVCVLVFALLGTAGPAAAASPKSGWVNLGVNVGHGDSAEKNCIGFQGGLSVARQFMLRAQYSRVSWEQDDDTDTCDGIIGGDAGVVERSLLAGFVLGRSGFFVLAGPAAADFGEPDPGPTGGTAGRDTGTRYELGWNPGLGRRSPGGLEIVLFRHESDLQDFHGLALSLAIGFGR